MEILASVSTEAAMGSELTPSDPSRHAGVNEGASAADRREFLRGSLRLLSAGVLLGGTGFAVGRAGLTRCDRPNPCGECPAFGGCERPRAEAFRAEQTDFLPRSLESKGGPR